MKNNFLSPNKIFQQIDIKEDMIIADLGCGNGYMTTKAAQIVGDGGKVYAVDVQKMALSDVNSKAKLYNLRNIETIWANIEKAGSLKITPNSVDITLLVQILHQSKLRKNIYEEAKRITKKNGKIVIVEWKKEELPMGTPMELRLDKEKTLKEAEHSGLKLVKELRVGDHHYGYLMENK